MNVGSLFTGIGGFDLGLERAGMRVVWQCELDPYCQRVLRLRWPGVRLFGDIAEVRTDTAEPVDVICGGFPCQDISLAGRGAGIDGERSGLWSEMFRVVCELRPRFVLVENVPALTSRGLDRVLGDLASGGYDAEWDCIPASAFGAPHQRDRIWVVAYPRSESGRVAEHRSGGQGWQPADPREPAVVRQGDGQDRPEGLAPCDRAGDVADPNGEPNLVNAERNGRGSRGPRRPDPSRAGQQQPALQIVADADSAGRREQRRPESVPAELAPPERFSGWPVEPDVGRVANGVPARVDRLRSLGNSLVPDIAEWIGRRLMERA